MKNLLLTSNKGLIKICSAVAICLLIAGTSTAQKPEGSDKPYSLETEQTESLIGDQDKVGEQTRSTGIELLVYPNPSTGIFNVSVDNITAKIRVFDRMMQPIEAPIQKLLNRMYRVDLTNAVAGIYIIQVATESGMATKQVSKR